MQFLAIAALLFTSVNAHAIFQKISVNGVDKGTSTGIRIAQSNNPIQDVSSSDMACNAAGSSSQVIDVPAGANVGAFWAHLLGGPQGANDVDNPIAPSHKGPIQYWMAKVDNAATASPANLKWFKISSDGLDTSTGQWAVDRMYAAGGWHYTTIPKCVASGNYLLKVELLALHSAGGPNGFQFYTGCAQINVVSGGSFTGSNFVNFPGTYKADDAGILISIYGNTGVPDNGRKPYTAPGGAVQSCPAGGASPVPSTSATRATTPVPATSTNVPATTAKPVTTTAQPVTSTVKPVTTTAKPATTAAPGSGAGVPLYGQCGGNGFTGATTCAQGTCKFSNDWYSQCL